MIYSSSSCDLEKNNRRKKLKHAKTRENLVQILDRNKKSAGDRQKDDLRQTLQKFEKKKLKPQEFRILQGVLLKDFGILEQERDQMKAEQKNEKRKTAKLKKWKQMEEKMAQEAQNSEPDSIKHVESEIKADAQQLQSKQLAVPHAIQSEGTIVE